MSCKPGTAAGFSQDAPDLHGLGSQVVYEGPLSRVSSMYCIRARADKKNSAAGGDALSRPPQPPKPK